jgi:lipopolysaccharide transport system ATP-binding protein
MSEHFMQNSIDIRSLKKGFRAGRSTSVLARLLGNKGAAMHTALHDIDLHVQKGEAVGVIGGNGSGKTTLAKSIAGIYRVSSGEVNISGQALYISGFGGLIDKHMTVSENIALLGSVIGLRRSEAKRSIHDILAAAELEGYENDRAGSLSDGMLARLSFFSLMHFVRNAMPEILLLDEVLSAGGDMRFREKATAAIRSVIASGVTVLVISHALPAIEALCPRTIWMEKGTIRMDGATSEVIAAYKATR